MVRWEGGAGGEAGAGWVSEAGGGRWGRVRCEVAELLTTTRRCKDHSWRLWPPETSPETEKGEKGDLVR